jgi:hypothetical protein
MTTTEGKVYPAAGFDLTHVPHGMVLTVRYVEAAQPPKSQEELDRAIRAVRVGLNATQATELANALLRSAQIVQAPIGPTN